MKKSYTAGLDILGTGHPFTPYGRTFKKNCFEKDASGKCLMNEAPNITVFGMFDIGSAQLRMNELKQVPVIVALDLLKGGQKAIDTARQIVNDHNLHKDGGDKKRDEIYYKLQWHANTLSGLASTPNEIYSSAEDLKNWVMQAYIAQNAAEEGAGAGVLGKAWNDYLDMWVAVGKTIAALPKAVAKAVGEAASTAIESITGVPVWAFAVGGTLLVGLLGYGAYKILVSPTGGAIVGTYLGARRR